MSEKKVVFNGVSFTRDDKTGYYLNSTIRKRLHRYVWECSNGPIPDGYHIHHVDGNKNNNDLSNLQLLEHNEHAHHHGKEERNIKKMKEKVQPLGIKKAVEWHKSDEGREWHKEHYQKTLANAYGSFKCEQCGDEFDGKSTGQNRFCSNKCKSKWRRDSGIDNENRICGYCGNEFVINKYKKNKFCSKVCSNKAVPRLPQLKN